MPRRRFSSSSSRSRSRSRPRRSQSREDRDRASRTTRSSPSRSRDRERSLVRVRSRSRTREYSRAGRADSQNRSTDPVDRTNNRTVNNQGGDNGNEFQRFQVLLDKQQASIASLLSEQRKELFDKVESGKKHKFRHQNLEKQFEVISEFSKITKRAISNLKKGYNDKVKTLLYELQESIEEQEQDLITADISRHGWLTVSRLKNRGSLTSNLLKKIEKVDENLDKKRRRFSREDGGKFGFRPRRMDQMPYRANVKTFKSNGQKYQQKRSPEQLLEEAVRQTRAGKCTHCDEEGHFYRECPSFWEKVRQSRRTNAKN